MGVASAEVLNKPSMIERASVGFAFANAESVFPRDTGPAITEDDMPADPPKCCEL